MAENEEKEKFIKEILSNPNKDQKLQAYLIKSLEESAKSTRNLKSKLLWLNIVLTAATAIGAIATIIMAINSFR